MSGWEEWLGIRVAQETLVLAQQTDGHGSYCGEITVVDYTSNIQFISSGIHQAVKAY